MIFYFRATQRISTRLFICLLIVSITTLLFYTSLITITKTVKVEEPPLSQYLQLYSTYEQTLKCPCSQISINYKKFIHVEYTLHQVCNSIFVSQSWIEYLQDINRLTFNSTDFNRIGSSTFQGLRSFCKLINNTIYDSLIEFYSRQYVSASVVPLKLFISETEVLIIQFNSSMVNTFLLFLSMIRDTTQANALFSALETNYKLTVKDNDPTLHKSEQIYDGCNCGFSSTCIVQSFIYDYPNIERLFKIPGFYAGCYVIESLLESTLECFFDRQCIDDLQYYFLMPMRIFVDSAPMVKKRINVTALESSLLNRYFINSPIKDLVDNLMIEEWNASSIYGNYYNECKPIQCTYTIQTRNDLIYIFTTLLGISGGLITVLKLIVPRLVKFIRRKKEQRQLAAVTNNQHRVTILWHKSKHFFQNLNLFESVPPSTDEHELHTQRISTKLLIFFLIVSMTILLLYTSLITITKTVKVEEPPLSQYLQLYSTYEQTLKCPCNQISINYKKFLHIEYTLHQVCNSIFVSQSWIEYLTELNRITLMTIDFRVIGQSAFQALRLFCELINKTISDSLVEFYSRQYVSASVISSKLFTTETEILIDQFNSSMKKSFLSTLSMIRSTTQINALLSGLLTNYIIGINLTDLRVVSSELAYHGCNCGFSSTCIGQSSIYAYPNKSILFKVPGFYAGCYVIESLLESTLECFFDQQCINDLQHYLFFPSQPNVTALNSSLLNGYFINSPIKYLVDNLMIEKWNASSIYENYYNECKPIQCTYNIQTRNDLIYIFTTLFGIAGGLNAVLEWVVPRLVKFIMYYIRKLRRRVLPEIQTGQT